MYVFFVQCYFHEKWKDNVFSIDLKRKSNVWSISSSSSPLSILFLTISSTFLWLQYRLDVNIGLQCNEQFTAVMYLTFISFRSATKNLGKFGSRSGWLDLLDLDRCGCVCNTDSPEIVLSLFSEYKFLDELVQCLVADIWVFWIDHVLLLVKLSY